MDIGVIATAWEVAAMVFALACATAVVALSARWFFVSIVEVKHLAVGVFVYTKLRMVAKGQEDPEEVKDRLWSTWSNYVDKNL